jgi:hypothetical protein
MKTFEELINDANKIFNNKYEYDGIYKKDKNYFYKAICKKHGNFEKNISNHIVKKQGCPMCSKPAKLTTEIFIDKANIVHNNTYDYSNVIYTHCKNKINIKCNKHGIFSQSASNHLTGQKCPKCSNRHKITNEDFIVNANKIHNNKYDYSEINYKNNHTEIKILCKEHGYFNQMPLNHLKGNQCYKCSGIVKTNDDFIKKSNIIHKNIYNYDKTIYKSTRKKVIITCKIHNDFEQSPNDHLNGCGCPKCSIGNYSKICIEWLNKIMEEENIFIQHAENIGEKEIIVDNKKIKFDGYCKKTNTVYELNGDFFHGNPKLYNLNDVNPLVKKTFEELYNNTINRENIIKKEGYNLIAIWESEYKKNNRI